MSVEAHVPGLGWSDPAARPQAGRKPYCKCVLSIKTLKTAPEAKKSRKKRKMPFYDSAQVVIAISRTYFSFPVNTGCFRKVRRSIRCEATIKMAL